jgi:transposase
MPTFRAMSRESLTGVPLSDLMTSPACDFDGADLLLPQIAADIVIADKGFDADERVFAPLEKAGKTTVIPPRANRKHQRDYDIDLYQARHLIENFFAKLKQFRAIATRYDKRAINFLAGIYLASIRHLAQLRTGPSTTLADVLA